MVTFSLDNNMYSIFQKGLTILQSHKKPILEEWENLLLHFKNTGRKSSKSVEMTVNYFSNLLFSNQVEIIKSDDKITYLPSNHGQASNFKTNHFIISLLENAVHNVIQNDEEDNYEIHQAVHYLFSKISEEITSLPYNHYFSIDNFLRSLVTSKQLPIKWTAIAMNNNNTYIVHKWFNHIDQNLLSENESINANSIYELSEMLLNQMEESEQHLLNVLTIPYEDVVLLICTNSKEASRLMPFITYALQIFDNSKKTLKMTKTENHWKDAVIMFNESIIHSNNYNEAVETITAGFVNFLPFERCALFSYSDNDDMGFGLFGHRIDNKAIQSITEDIENLPIIKSNIKILKLFKNQMNFLQPIYINDASLGFPSKYVEQFQLKSLVVAPIFTTSKNKLLGAALLDKGPNSDFEMTQETFSALIKFGRSAGEILAKYQKESHSSEYDQFVHLSPREKEVLKLMAEGSSTNEAASELNLSEYTVRDYVSTIMQKMDARNRTEAVARAIRNGII